jgi:glyoxylase-like metal-dependent hydrolase (beta-lactamase superfamily II)/rhodanese-related sulfurtransferase
MPVQEITADELRRALERHEPLTVLDVRPSAERSEWTIPGSRHVDAYAELWRGESAQLEAAAATLPRDKPIVTVCARGRTSMLAARVLEDLGFRVTSLTGGMGAWTLAWNTANVPLPADAAAAIVQVRRTGKGCLSYVIGSGDEAAVVDPSVEPDVYMKIAESRGWRIVAVLDTHVHADHVSRAYELADLTGSRVYLPEQKRVLLAFTPLADGHPLSIGRSVITALSTPGHTLESMCFKIDETALCTGDTLFLEGVGRPDLKAEGDGSARRAVLLYRSLRDRVLPLDDRLVVLPAHASEPIAFDGIPHARPLAEVRRAIALTDFDEQTFMANVLSRIPPNPPNHLRIVQINEGHEPVPEDVLELEAGANRCAISV